MCVLAGDIRSSCVCVLTGDVCLSIVTQQLEAVRLWSSAVSCSGRRRGDELLPLFLGPGSFRCSLGEPRITGQALGFRCLV